MQYNIIGGTFPVVTCTLADGESMITEGGSMVWMTPNMEMSTTGGGIGKMFSKAVSGESLFQNIWTARGNAMIAFGSSFPGRIMPIKIAAQAASGSRRCPSPASPRQSLRWSQAETSGRNRCRRAITTAAPATAQSAT